MCMYVCVYIYGQEGSSLTWDSGYLYKGKWEDFRFIRVWGFFVLFFRKRELASKCGKRLTFVKPVWASTEVCLVFFVPFYFILYFIFWDRVSLCHQAGMQWHGLHLLETPPPRFKRFPCLSLPSSWDYRHPPSCPGDFWFFSRVRVSPCWPGLWPTPDLSWSTHLGLPKCWDYRCEPSRLANF